MNEHIGDSLGQELEAISFKSGALATPLGAYLLLAPMIGLIVYFSIRTITGVDVYSPVACIPTIIALLAVLWLMVIRPGKQEIRFYERGFVLSAPDSTRTVQWKDLLELRSHYRFVGNSFEERKLEYTIREADGSKQTYLLPAIDSWRNALRKHSQDILLDRSLAHIRKGRRIFFGTVSLNASTLFWVDPFEGKEGDQKEYSQSLDAIRPDSLVIVTFKTERINLTFLVIDDFKQTRIPLIRSLESGAKKAFTLTSMWQMPANSHILVPLIKAVQADQGA